MILDWCKVVEADGAVFDFTHFNDVKMVDNNLSQFIEQWDYTLFGMKSAPEDKILQVLFEAQIERHRDMEVDMAD